MVREAIVKDNSIHDISAGIMPNVGDIRDVSASVMPNVEEIEKLVIFDKTDQLKVAHYLEEKSDLYGSVFGKTMHALASLTTPMSVVGAAAGTSVGGVGGGILGAFIGANLGALGKGELPSYLDRSVNAMISTHADSIADLYDQHVYRKSLEKYMKDPEQFMYDIGSFPVDAAYEIAEHPIKTEFFNALFFNPMGDDDMLKLRFSQETLGGQVGAMGGTLVRDILLSLAVAGTPLGKAVGAKGSFVVSTGLGSFISEFHNRIGAGDDTRAALLNATASGIASGGGAIAAFTVAPAAMHYMNLRFAKALSSGARVFAPKVLPSVVKFLDAPVTDTVANTLANGAEFASWSAAEAYTHNLIGKAINNSEGEAIVPMHEYTPEMAMHSALTGVIIGRTSAVGGRILHYGAKGIGVGATKAAKTVSLAKKYMPWMKEDDIKAVEEVAENMDKGKTVDPKSAEKANVAKTLVGLNKLYRLDPKLKSKINLDDIDPNAVDTHIPNPVMRSLVREATDRFDMYYTNLQISGAAPNAYSSAYDLFLKEIWPGLHQKYKNPTMLRLMYLALGGE